MSGALWDKGPLQTFLSQPLLQGTAKNAPSLVGVGFIRFRDNGIIETTVMHWKREWKPLKYIGVKVGIMETKNETTITLSPKPSTLKPKPSTLNPKPSTLNYYI